MEWNPRFSVGVERLDIQHQDLLHHAARLQLAIAQGELDEVWRMLFFLRGYIVDHFSAEELQMRASAFPGFAAHKAAHDQFMREFLQMELDFESAGVSLELAERLRGFVVDWLIRHMLGLDQELGRHLRAHAEAHGLAAR